jgi:uncharacterized membrane protein YhaH (DUF805 family)
MEKYFKFNGTATRSEYWGVNILAGIAAFVLILLGAIIAGSGSTIGIVFGAILMIATFIAAIWISVATSIRRCVNAGINPWWTLAVIIPYVGTIVFIVLGCLKTDNE